MQRSNVGTRISGELPPGREKLAHALNELYQHMGAPTLEAASQLIGAEGYKKDSSELSRYLNGDRLPAPEFLTCFFRAAVTAAGGRTPRRESGDPLELHDLRQLRHQAERHRRCRTCADLGRSNESLREENRQLLTRLAGLEKALAHAPQRATPLPVRPARGDRQRTGVPMPAVKHLADRATALKLRGGPTAVISLLGDVSGVLSPLEKAASITLFRELQYDDFADTLVQLCGRSRSEDGVIKVALQLYEHGMADDATAVLQAAVR